MVNFTKWLTTVLGLSSWFENDEPTIVKRQVVMYQLSPAQPNSHWEAFEADLHQQWSAGVSQSVFGYYQHGTPVGVAKYWSAKYKGDGRERAFKLADTMHVKILLAVGGPGDITWVRTEPTTYVTHACSFAKEHQFHGLDFQVEGFFEDAQQATGSVQWLIQASKTAHEQMGYVMHTPHARYFSNPSPSQFYGAVVTGAQEYVNKFMVRYYNEQTMAYNSYDDIYGNNQINHNSILQIATALNMKEKTNKFGVVKGYNFKTVNSGFVPLESLRLWTCKAEEDPRISFDGAVGFWTRDYMNARFGNQMVQRKLAGFSSACKSDSDVVTPTKPPTTTSTEAETTTGIDVNSPQTQMTRADHSLPSYVPTPVVLACYAATLETAPCRAACKYFHEYNRECRSGSSTAVGLIECVKENTPYCFPANATHKKQSV